MNITSRFPFIHAVTQSSLYQGCTIWESTYGGVFALNPLLFLSLIPLHPIRKKIPLAKRGVLLFLLFGAVAIAVIDANMAGILERYQADFLWMLVLAVVVICFSLYERAKTASREMQSVFIGCFTAVFLVFLGLQTLQLFVTDHYDLAMTNPDLFYRFFYRIQFWL